MAVLDTNVVLAIWLWKDPRLDGLASLLAKGDMRWLSDGDTWRECLHELRPARCAALGLTMESVRAELERVPRLEWAPTLTAAPATLLPGGLRCTDPDDQKFIDLAVSGRAQWLFTRDRAVLRLRRRAATVGLRIADPTNCSAETLLSAAPISGLRP